MKSINKHQDILFLERRLKLLVKYEMYESAAIVHRWIKELNILHQSEGVRQT